MRYLRQNTATRVTVGPFLDKTDGVTPEVALTATNEKLTFTVDDGGVPTLVIDANATASGGSNDLVHITGDDAGYYDLELTAAQTNYVGRACLSIGYATDHVPVFHEFEILPPDVYDAMHISNRARQVTPDATPGATSFAVTDATLPSTALGAGYVNCIAQVVESDVANDVTPASIALITGYSKTGDVGTFTYAGGWNRTPTGTAAQIRIDLYPGAIGKAEAVASAIDARLLAAASVTRIDAREATGGTITVGAGSHTTTSCVASDATNGTRTKGRLGVVTSGGIVKRVIRFASDIGASGAFTYTDTYGNAVPAALAENDVIQF